MGCFEDGYGTEKGSCNRSRLGLQLPRRAPCCAQLCLAAVLGSCAWQVLALRATCDHRPPSTAKLRLPVHKNTHDTPHRLLAALLHLPPCMCRTTPLCMPACLSAPIPWLRLPPRVQAVVSPRPDASSRCLPGGWVLGLTTCYDLRFPELYAHLAFDRGAQLLAVPSAFTTVTGEQAHGGR